MMLLDIFWKLIKDKPETATRWAKWSEVTEKPEFAFDVLDFGMINSDSRYVKANPYGDVPLLMTVEIKINGKWADPGWLYISGGLGQGVRVSYVEGEGIVVQTGSSRIKNVSSWGGGGHGDLLEASSAQCRVLVWRLVI